MNNELKEQLKEKLEEIFRFENKELDFGIYRILNYKRKEIKEFIEKELIETIEEQLKLLGEEEKKKLIAKAESFKRKDSVIKYLEAVKKREGEKIKILEELEDVKEYRKIQEGLEKIKVSEDVERAIYNHLINFFSRYYDNGDFISKRRYGRGEKYVVPYDGEETLLYWANKDQYYVKTTEYFRRYTFKATPYKGSLAVNFRVVEAEEEKGNLKSEEKKFFVLSESPFELKKNELDIYFEYRALTEQEKGKFGERAKQGDINKHIIEVLKKKLGKETKTAVLFRGENGIEKHLNKYTKRNTMDYFIHKDLKGFLQRELDFYIKNEVLSFEDLQILEKEEYYDKVRLYLLEARVIRNIALKITEFLAQIENFQKKLWEKKKFVINTDYVITLDKIKEYAGEEFLESILAEILENKEQIKEWKELFRIKVKTKNGLIEKRTLKGKEYKKLPIDTKYFGGEFKWKLIAALSENSDLDAILDGVLIKSENWQALNTVVEKWKEKAKSIYIDPPYNTGSDEFLYKDKYQHSSWLTLMNDRLGLARDFMTNKGVFFSNIDDNEVDNLGILLKIVFGSDKTDKIVWKKASEGRWGKMKNVMTFRKDHEYLMVAYRKEEKLNKILEKPRFVHEYGNPDNDPRGPYKAGSISRKEEASDPKHPNYYTVISPSGKKFTRQWDMSKEEFDRLNKEGRIYWGREGNSVPALKIFLNEERQITPYSILIEKGTNTEAKEEFLDILGSVFESIIDKINPKPSKLIKTLIQLSTYKDSIILDFFAGSGTAAHAVMKLNAEDGGKRKFILVEIADYFDYIVIPRIKKVGYSFKWKEGKPQDTNGLGVFFKYQYLEQYEDSLENVEFGQPQKELREFQDYFVKYMLDFETRNSQTFLNISNVEDPFNYKLRVIENYEPKDVSVDLVETFNYLLGLSVQKIKRFNDNKREYVLVFGEVNDRKVAIVWRPTKNMDFEKDKKIIEEKIREFNPDDIYVNGDCAVKNFRQIENDFKELMFEKVK